MKIPFSTGFYEHATRDVNYQRCVNMYASPAGEGGEDNVDKLVLVSAPGLVSAIDLNAQSVRRLMQVQDRLFCVADFTFYELYWDETTQVLTSEVRGTLDNTAGIHRISYDANPLQIMFTDQINAYIYNYNTNVFEKITDGDFEGAKTVTFMDSYFVFNVPGTARMYVTAQNDGSSIDPSDVATAEAKQDDTQSIQAFKSDLWVFGEKSIEIWFNAANVTGFPFSRRVSALIDLGCAAAASVKVVNDNVMMWLDSRGFVSTAATNYNSSVVSTPAMNTEINKYKNISDAFACVYNEQGHTFYMLSFPSEKRTWVYDLLTNKWHERSYQNPEHNKEEHHVANDILEFSRNQFVASRLDGNIYIMSRDYHTDAGTYIRRILTTPHFSDEFDFIGVNQLELHVDAGHGVVTGQGSEPRIVLQYSNDGGYTWSHELWRDIGARGNYNTRVRWNRLGTGREWVLQFQYSDPTPLTVMGLYANIEQSRHDK